ncbi:MAG: hypothetical protein IPN49_12750 [Saprospiraceae bacterium]|nr:hypothetical protein [Saprospiraceae bacterium]
MVLSEGETREIFTNELLEGGPYKCWQEYDLDILENNVAVPTMVCNISRCSKNIIARVKDITTNNTLGHYHCRWSRLCGAQYQDTKSRCNAEGDCTSRPQPY